MRQQLEEYLDGALDAVQRVELEARLAREPELAGMLSRMKRERALRAAALASYEPARDDAVAAAEYLLSQTTRPATVGYVGRWAKRSIGVAAMLALMASAFAVGRSMSSETILVRNVPTFHVIYPGEGGEALVKDFDQEEDAIAFAHQQETMRLNSNTDEGTMLVDLSRPGEL